MWEEFRKVYLFVKILKPTSRRLKVDTFGAAPQLPSGGDAGNYNNMDAKNILKQRHLPVAFCTATLF